MQKVLSYQPSPFHQNEHLAFDSLKINKKESIKWYRILIMTHVTFISNVIVTHIAFTARFVLLVRTVATVPRVEKSLPLLLMGLVKPADLFATLFRGDR